MRYIGVSLISLAIFFCGLISSRRFSRANRLRASLILLLREIKSGVQASKPLDRIYNDFDDAFLEEISFLEALRTPDDNQLLKALKRCGETELLTKAEQAELLLYAGKAGLLCGAQAETESCLALLSLLEEKRREHEQDNKKRADMAIKLGIIGAVAVFALAL